MLEDIKKMKSLKNIYLQLRLNIYYNNIEDNGIEII